MSAQNDHIKNRDAYFKTVLKNMNLKENIKQSEIEDNEIFVEDPSTCSDFLDNFDLNKEFTDRNLLGWIDMIENKKLHAVVKRLSLENQIFLSYIVKECKTQSELSHLYKLSQAQICEKINKIIRVIKHNMLNREK